ncbi:MAG TPA: hypothetical protein VJV79_01155 [Polyangiaceae bacterium]|nr:hypothetical protein [Polyangiaceae bacterium]
MTILRSGFALCLIAGGFALLGCSSSPLADESLTENAEALVTVDEFLYFRCNATAWGADSSTLMQATSDPNVVTITYQVTQAWLLSAGDTCIVTRTNQKNGWGSASSSFSEATPATPIVVPGGEALVPSSANFRVRYPALGTYTATIDWATRRLSIVSGTPSAPAALPFWLRYCSEPTCGGLSPLVVYVCPSSDPNCTPTRETTVVPEVDGRQIDQILFPLQLPSGFAPRLVSGAGQVTGSLIFSTTSPIRLRSDVDLTLSYYNVTPTWGGTTHLNFVSQTFSSAEVVTTVFRFPSFLTSGEPAEFHSRGRSIIVQESQIAQIQPGRMNASFLPSEMATLGEGNFSDGNLNITINYSNPPFIATSGGVFNAAMPRFAHEYVHELFSEIAQSYPGNSSCLNEGLADAFAFASGFLPERDFGPIGLRGGNDFDQGCAGILNDFELHDAGNCPLWQVHRLGLLSESFARAMLHPLHVIDFDSCDLASARTGNALLVLFSEAAGQDLTSAIQLAQIPNAGSLAAAKLALGIP